MFNYLINTDKLTVVGRHEDLDALEEYADTETTFNFDIVDKETGFSKSYTVRELKMLADNLGIPNASSFDGMSRGNINVVMFRRMEQDDIPEINPTEDQTMAAKKKTTTKKPATKKKVATKPKAPVKKPAAAKHATSGRKPALSGDQKVKRGNADDMREGTVFHAIYQACTKQQTVDTLIEGLIDLGYTPPRRSDPADRKYLRGYVVAMVNEGILEKV